MEHRGIRDAIAAADPVAAEEAMSAHLRSSFHRFARAFGAGPAALPAALPGAAPGRLTP
jgi:DNA-binding GntR family transcriptional regulator